MKILNLLIEHVINFIIESVDTSAPHHQGYQICCWCWSTGWMVEKEQVLCEYI